MLHLIYTIFHPHHSSHLPVCFILPISLKNQGAGGLTECERGFPGATLFTSPSQPIIPCTNRGFHIVTRKALKICQNHQETSRVHRFLRVDHLNWSTAFTTDLYKGQSSSLIIRSTPSHSVQKRRSRVYFFMSRDHYNLRQLWSPVPDLIRQPSHVCWNPQDNYLWGPSIKSNTTSVSSEILLVSEVAGPPVGSLMPTDAQMGVYTIKAILYLHWIPSDGGMFIEKKCYPTLSSWSRLMKDFILSWCEQYQNDHN